MRPVELNIDFLTRADMRAVFQPIVSLERGELFASEGLARCVAPSLACPQRLFLEASKRRATGIVGRIIREVMFDDVPTSRLFINLHPEELSARWLVQPDDPLCEFDGELFLEVTETTAIEYYSLCRSVLREVCDRTGARLVVDDLGSGYSNLKRIIDLEPACVKLDLALIRGVDVNKRQRVLVRKVIELCHELDAFVVAEGIESYDELSAVRDCGADLGQGFFLSRPSSSAESVRWPVDYRHHLSGAVTNPVDADFPKVKV